MSNEHPADAIGARPARVAGILPGFASKIGAWPERRTFGSSPPPRVLQNEHDLVQTERNSESAEPTGAQLCLEAVIVHFLSCEREMLALTFWRAVIHHCA